MSAKALTGLKKAQPRPAKNFGKYPIVDQMSNVKLDKNPKDMTDAELTATHDYLEDDHEALAPLDAEADKRFGRNPASYAH